MARNLPYDITEWEMEHVKMLFARHMCPCKWPIKLNYTWRNVSPFEMFSIYNVLFYFNYLILIIWTVLLSKKFLNSCNGLFPVSGFLTPGFLSGINVGGDYGKMLGKFLRFPIPWLVEAGLWKMNVMLLWWQRPVFHPVIGCGRLEGGGGCVAGLWWWWRGWLLCWKGSCPVWTASQKRGSPQ